MALAGTALATPNGRPSVPGDTRATTTRPAPSAIGLTASASHEVVLPTGDLILISDSAGGGTVLSTVDEFSGGGATAIRLADAQYIFPRSVNALIGATLDPELFNATAIAARGGRTDVRVTYASVDSPTAVPGVEITKRNGLTGTGVITRASSRALAATLAKSSAANAYAGIRSLTAGTAQKRAETRWPMYTLTLTAIGLDGQPVPAVISYINTNDPERGNGIAYATNGTATVSVGPGPYELMLAQPSADFGRFSFVNVTARVSGPTTASVDLRSATTELKTTLDRPLAIPERPPSCAARSRTSASPRRWSQTRRPASSPPRPRDPSPGTCSYTRRCPPRLSPAYTPCTTVTPVESRSRP